MNLSEFPKATTGCGDTIIARLETPQRVVEAGQTQDVVCAQTIDSGRFGG